MTTIWLVQSGTFTANLDQCALSNKHKIHVSNGFVKERSRPTRTLLNAYNIIVQRLDPKVFDIVTLLFVPWMCKSLDVRTRPLKYKYNNALGWSTTVFEGEEVMQWLWGSVVIKPNSAN